MRRTIMVGAAWLVATAVSILVAHAAVGEVRGRVVDRPQALSAPVSTPVPITTPPTTLASGSTTTTPIGPATSTTEATVPSTESTVPGTAVTSTTSASPTTSTPPTTPSGEIRTYSTEGGSVSIEVFPDHLTLLGAVPAPGYSVAEQENTPTKIEIEFKSGSDEIHFKARLEGGELKIEVEGGEEHD